MQRSTEQISIKLPKEHYAQLDLIASRTGISRHALVRKAVANLLLLSEHSHLPRKSLVFR